MGNWTASSSLWWSKERAYSWSVPGLLAGLACLAILPYLPFLTLPLISDDYVQIHLARSFAGWKGLQELAGDALYRCRATSLWLTWLLDAIFGPRAAVFFAAGIVLHLINTWLIFALGRWEVVGYRVSAIAAAFFAVYEGHQEAVVWHAASPELLLFLFSTAALLCWVEWLQTGMRSRGLYAGACALFLLALLSKEPAVMTPVLLAFASWSAGRLRASVVWLAPMFALCAGYTLLAFAAKQDHLHFNDGTFSLSAPFVLTLLNSGLRLFWFWGLLASIAIWFLDKRPGGFSGVMPAFWIVVTFLPYSFLTYMLRVPSRHTYWASAGLAFIVAGGILSLTLRPFTARLLPWVAGLLLVHNVSYLWIKKLPQFEARAAVTERFVQFASMEPRPIRVKCFEVSPVLARFAAQIRLNRPLMEIRLDGDPPFPGKSEAQYCSEEKGGRR